jgi:uncharacterized protein (DUF697 family)
MVEKKDVKDQELKEKKPVENQVEQEEVTEEPKLVFANKIVKRYTWWSVGAGVIPIPFLNLGALAGVHLKMLHRLAQHYDVPFSDNRGKSILAALIGTITADSLSWGGFSGFVRSIPVIGVMGAATLPIYAGAITYAIGKLFIQHFESGGTFLDFEPQKVKDYFKELYEEGKAKASKLKTAKA